MDRRARLALAALVALGAFATLLRDDGREAALRRLEARYGPGCIALLDREGGAVPMGCRLPGFEIGFARWYKGLLRLEAMGTRRDRPAWASVDVDLFAPDGRPLGRMPEHDFMRPRLALGKTSPWGWPLPAGVGLPLLVAVSPHRAGGTPRGAERPPSVPFLGLLSAPAAIQDDAPSIRRGLDATAKGAAYVLPARPLFLPDGLTLGPADSGKRLVGFKGAALVFGQPVTGWRKARPDDPLYPSLKTNGTAGSVLVADVAELAPLLRDGGGDGLILGDRPQSQTVYPLPTGGTRGDGWRDVTGSTPLSGKAQTIRYSPTSVPKTWRHADAVIVEGFANEYRYARARMEAVRDGEVDVTGYEGRKTDGWTKGRNARMRFRNVAEEIRLPGQYYLDLPDRKLYWYPPQGYDGSAPTYLSTAGGIAVRGADGVTIMGSGASLPVVGGLRTAIRVRETEGLNLTRLDVVGGNGDGIETDLPKDVGVENLPPCRNVVLDAVNVRECGERGVFLLGGDRLNRVPGGIVVRNCFVERVGRLVPDSQALTVLGMAPKVVDTTVKDVPQIGIALNDPSGTPLGQRDGCNDALVDHCLIDGACGQVSDLGGFYHGRNWAALGNVLQNTTVRGVRAYAGQGTGQCDYGIYIDDGQAGTTVQDCTVTDCDAAVIVGGGWGVTLRRLRLEGWSKWSVLIDARQSPGQYQHANSEPDGRNYRSLTQWTGGRFEVPAPWRGVYPRLQEWIDSAGSAEFGAPRFNVVQDVSTGTTSASFATAETSQGYRVTRNRAAFALPGATVTPTGVTTGGRFGAPAPPSGSRRG